MPKKSDTPTKASESVVSRLLAKILRVPARDAESVEEVCTAYVDAGGNECLRRIMGEVYGLYPWVTNVATDVMADRLTPLTEHLLSMPGTVFVLKDSGLSADDSIWIAVGEPPADMLSDTARFQNRGLLRTFTDPDGDLGQVFAFQLNSCLP